MSWIGGAISAVGSIAGDSMSASGQRAANAQSYANQIQAEGWESQMSNTAMTRRVSDLKAAGLNPLLAVSEGGASTPGVGIASAQNPNAAFGNMGSQLSSAASVAQQGSVTQAQTTALNAQAANSAADTALKTTQASKMAGVDTEAVQQNIAESKTQQMLMVAQGDAATSQARLNNQQVMVAQAQIPKIQAEIAAIGASQTQTEAQTHLTNLQSAMQGLSNDQFKFISPALITSAANAAKQSGIQARLSELQLPQAHADSNMWQGNPGLSYVNAVMNWLHIGANIGSGGGGNTYNIGR